MAAGGCIALRTGPIPDFEAIIVGELGDGEILMVWVIGDSVAIDPLLGPADRVGEMVLQRGPILLCLLTYHLNYNPNCKNQTPSKPHFPPPFISPYHPDII